MPDAASTASLGDAGTIEFASAAGRTVFDIRAGIMTGQAALKPAQACIRGIEEAPATLSSEGSF